MYVLIVFCRLLVYNNYHNTNDWRINNMQDEYYLFLDETKPNAHGSYFALGGYAIKKKIMKIS